jgi:hypothetical protein
LSPNPLVSNSSICCSRRTLGAILAILAIWRSSRFGGFRTTYRGRLRHLTFTSRRGRDPILDQRRERLGCRRLVLTHPTKDLLERRAAIDTQLAEDGLVLTI